MSTKTQKNVDEKNSLRVKELEKEVAKLENNIQDLVVTIDAVEDEKLNITTQLKKALADHHNLEMNIEKRINLMYMQSRKSLAEKLIPLVDDLTMAVLAKQEMGFDEKGNAWANGVISIFDNLEKSLEEIGVSKFIPEKNSPFDPELHEALTVIDGKVSGLVFDVIQPGYILDGIVIRPARVVVTKGK